MAVLRRELLLPASLCSHLRKVMFGQLGLAFILQPLEELKPFLTLVITIPVLLLKEVKPLI